MHSNVKGKMWGISQFVPIVFKVFTLRPRTAYNSWRWQIRWQPQRPYAQCNLDLFLCKKVLLNNNSSILCYEINDRLLKSPSRPKTPPTFCRCFTSRIFSKKEGIYHCNHRCFICDRRYCIKIKKRIWNVWNNSQTKQIEEYKFQYFFHEYCLWKSK